MSSHRWTSPTRFGQIARRSAPALLPRACSLRRVWRAPCDRSSCRLGEIPELTACRRSPGCDADGARVARRSKHSSRLDDAERPLRRDDRPELGKGAGVEEGLGAKFWLGMVGVILAIGVGAILLFWLVSAAAYRWGFIGGLLFFGGILLVVAAIYDRTHRRQYDDDLSA